MTGMSLEKGQEMTKSLKHLACEEKLKLEGCTSLEKAGRLLAMHIRICSSEYTYLWGLKEERASVFSVMSSDRIRDSGFKLK